MASVRTRQVILFVAIASASAESMIACSSDKPPPSGGITDGDGAVFPPGIPLDSAADQDSSADAAADAPHFDDDGSCLDDRPAPTIDGGFKGGDEAGVPICPTTGTCVTYCNDAVAHMKLGQAQVTVKCMLELPSCSNTNNVNLCFDNAYLESCKDTSSAGYCTPLVTACDPNAGAPGSLIDEKGCESFANGLSAGGRSTFSGCIQSKIDAGTCPNEVRLCTDQLRL